MDTIKMVITPRTRDLGGFTVGRVLPFAKQRMVGPFIFFDEIGPAEFLPDEGIDVRPHPHIGLATVTYLFEGAIRHRDNLGFDQLIQVGDVNWMIAGSGMVHSECTDDETRRHGQKMHGIQSWVALPEEHQETAPAFHHYPKETLPRISRNSADYRLIIGTAFGQSSPVATFSPCFYLGVETAANSEIILPDEHEDRALYLLSGEIEIDGQPIQSQTMIVFREDTTPVITTQSSTKLMLLGVTPLGKRHIWWNFVSTSEERIEHAKKDWATSSEKNFEGSVFTLPPEETDAIPIPHK